MVGKGEAHVPKSSECNPFAPRIDTELADHLS